MIRVMGAPILPSTLRGQAPPSIPEAVPEDEEITQTASLSYRAARLVENWGKLPEEDRRRYERSIEARLKNLKSR